MSIADMARPSLHAVPMQFNLTLNYPICKLSAYKLSAYNATNSRGCHNWGAGESEISTQTKDLARFTLYGIPLEMPVGGIGKPPFTDQ